MSFEKQFNSTSIIGGAAFAASMAGGLLGEIVQAVQRGSAARLQQGRHEVYGGDNALGLRMIERHVDHGARCALRTLDEAKRDLDLEAVQHSLGKDSNGAYMNMYRLLYLGPFEDIRYLRERNNELYAGIAHSSGRRRLGASDLGYIRMQWLSPVQTQIRSLVTSMDRRFRAVDGGLRDLGRTHGDVVFAWRALAGGLHHDAAAKLQNVHDTMEAVMYSEIVERRTARELGE